MRTLTFVLSSLLLVVGCTDSKSDDNADTGAGSGAGAAGDAHLIGLGFNSDTSSHELRSIDPDSAEVTAVGSVDFGADGYEEWFGVMTDSDAGMMYAVSTAGALHSIAMDGSSAEVVGTLSQSIQAMDVGTNGLIGVGYNRCQRSERPALG